MLIVRMHDSDCASYRIKNIKRKGETDMKHIIETDLAYIVTDRGQVFTDFKDKHTISTGYA